MYNNYFFDLYGTLMEVKTNQEDPILWEKMALYYGYYGAYYEPFEIKERFNQVLKKYLKNGEYEYPDIDIQDVFYKLFKDKNIRPKRRMSKEAAKVFRLLSTDYIKVYEGVDKLLQTLHDKNKNLYILANAQNVYGLYELRNGGIRHFFNDFFFSSDLGVCKPECAVIENLVKEENLNIDESILITGNPSDLIMTDKCGIDTLFINLDGDEKSGKGTYEILGRNFKEMEDILLR